VRGRAKVVRSTGQATHHEHRHVLTLPTVPASVRIARRTAALTLSSCGVAPGTSLVDSALLIVSELVASAVRHAHHRSPCVMITFIVGAEAVVTEVSDQDPRIPDLEPQTMGGGLRTVVGLAGAYGGALSVEPVPFSQGKTMRVRLPLSREHQQSW
jgi:anti-sigma regulatory factor (Ser/Thr protein kinase)